MKTTILLAASVLFFTSFLHAQIEEGKVQIGGQLDLQDYHYNQSSNNNYLTNIIVNPSIGRFYATNKLVGLFLYFSHSGFSSDKQYGYGGGVYFRQYQPILKGLYVFADEQAIITYSRSRNTTTQTPTITTGYSISAGFRPGIAYDLTRRMQLEMAYNNLLSLSYNYTKGSELFSLNSNLEGSAFQNLLVGFRFYLK